MSNKIRIPNERLFNIAYDGEDIDKWLIDNVGYGNWAEHFPITKAVVPYRSFSFKDEKHAVLFSLRWL